MSTVIAAGTKIPSANMASGGNGDIECLRAIAVIGVLPHRLQGLLNYWRPNPHARLPLRARMLLAAGHGQQSTAGLLIIHLRGNRHADRRFSGGSLFRWIAPLRAHGVRLARLIQQRDASALPPKDSQALPLSP